jgi:hypothetical protein
MTVTQLFAALGLILVASGTRVEATSITHTQTTTGTELISNSIHTGTVEYTIINATSSRWSDYDFHFVNNKGNTVVITGVSIVSGPYRNFTVTNSGSSADAEFAGGGLNPGKSFTVDITVKTKGPSSVYGTPSGLQVVPEPSTMALAGTGVLALAGMGWWRRRVRPHS